MKKFILFIILIFLFNSSKAMDTDDIYVDIKGAVKVPGAYTIKASSRVSDLIQKAGGLKEEADTSLINLSKKLIDQDVVIIYTVDEVLSMRKGDTAVKIIEKECMCPKVENVSCIEQKPKVNVININEASKEELMKLDGIGGSKADAIIEYRKNKKFEKPDDILNVKGIGKTIYEKNKDSIGV